VSGPTRFENSVCRFDEDEVLRRIFLIVGIEPPPIGKSRGYVERILKTADCPKDFRERFTGLMKILDAKTIEPTASEVSGETCVGPSLCVVNPLPAIGAIELHAGIGAIFRHGNGDTLFSKVAPITGPGLDRRRDYLLSIVEAGRHDMETTFS